MLRLYRQFDSEFRALVLFAAQFPPIEKLSCQRSLLWLVSATNIKILRTISSRSQQFRRTMRPTASARERQYLCPVSNSRFFAFIRGPIPSCFHSRRFFQISVISVNQR